MSMPFTLMYRKKALTMFRGSCTPEVRIWLLVEGTTLSQLKVAQKTLHLEGNEYSFFHF